MPTVPFVFLVRVRMICCFSTTGQCKKPRATITFQTHNAVKNTKKKYVTNHNWRGKTVERIDKVMINSIVFVPPWRRISFFERKQLSQRCKRL